jgi:adenosylhomocysteinase
MIVRVVEVDPICAMQACMDGFELVSAYNNGINTGRLEDVNTALMQDTDLIVTCTGNADVCDANMLQTIKRGAVVCNIGHFDNEIDTAYMRKNWRWETVKDQVHQIFRSDDPHDYLILLSEGRLVNLGNAMGHPSRIMDGSFANQVLAQMHLFEQRWTGRGSGPADGGRLRRGADPTHCEAGRLHRSGAGGPLQARILQVLTPAEGDAF